MQECKDLRINYLTKFPVDLDGGWCAVENFGYDDFHTHFILSSKCTRFG